MKSELTLADMQKMLPDYIFDKLDQSDKSKFESNLPDFPELKNEIASARNIFSKVDSSEYYSLDADRTRNLSVNVNKILDKKPLKFKRFSLANELKITAAALASLSVVFGIYKYNAQDNESNPIPVAVNSQIVKPAAAKAETAVKVKVTEFADNNRQTVKLKPEKIVKRSKSVDNKNVEIKAENETTDFANIEENDVIIDNYYSFYSSDYAGSTSEMDDEQYNTFIQELSHEDN